MGLAIAVRTDDTFCRALKDLGFSHVSARPKAYRQDPDAREGFKKNFADGVAEVHAKLAPRTPIDQQSTDVRHEDAHRKRPHLLAIDRDYTDHLVVCALNPRPGHFLGIYPTQPLPFRKQ